MKNLFSNIIFTIVLFAGIGCANSIEKDMNKDNAIQYINSHADGTDASIMEAVIEASEIYGINKDELLYSFYL